MNYEELLEYLDMADASEFEYFESMADLVESDEYIEEEALQELFYEADRDNVAELIEDYFNDISDGLPDDSGEIVTLLEQIKLSLLGLIRNAGDESDIRRFANEFMRFRNWYSFESEVEMIPEGENAPAYSSLRDAVTASRAEKLGTEKFKYNFENALDYELDSYTVSLADLAATGYDDNNGTIVFDKDDEEYGGNLSMEEDGYI